jgi:hypothetical protein
MHLVGNMYSLQGRKCNLYGRICCLQTFIQGLHGICILYIVQYVKRTCVCTMPNGKLISSMSGNMYV